MEGKAEMGRHARTVQLAELGTAGLRGVANLLTVADDRETRESDIYVKATGKHARKDN